MTGRSIAGQTTSVTTPEGLPADWYEDPTKVGELRYFDGTQWTEHVTIGGVQTTAPYAPAEAPPPAADAADAADADPAAAPSFTMTRVSQWRTEEEKPLDVNGPAGLLGRFATQLDGAPGYRFEDAQGGTVLALSKPGLKTAIEVTDPAGYPVGTITKVGRLHSRYDIARADGGAGATVRLVPGGADEWELQTNGTPAASITRTTGSPADSLNLAEVSYTVSITAPIDDQLQRLLLALPLAIDILDTQAL
ncbi:MAG: hypothetical protein QOG30_959 [Acidimicrobiaceae bacterium]